MTKQHKPSQRNVDMLNDAQEKVSRAQAMYFVNYQGLTHKQLEEARKELRSNGSEMAVVKNTLMNIALQEKNVDVKEKLQGAHATLFSYEDPVKTAKVLASFYKKYQLPTIEFGVLGDEILSDSEITKLATLPSREVLLAKLVGGMKSPINGLVYSLKGNLQKLVLTLKAVEAQKSASS
jgi:large subunit ribosomal protein L10